MGQVHHPQPGDELLMPAGQSTRPGTSATRQRDGCTGIGIDKGPMKAMTNNQTIGIAGVNPDRPRSVRLDDATIDGQQSR